VCRGDFDSLTVKLMPLKSFVTFDSEPALIAASRSDLTSYRREA
jgi:hypothetical protein